MTLFFVVCLCLVMCVAASSLSIHLRFRVYAAELKHLSGTLTKLDVSSNALSGDLSVLGRMTALATLDLHENRHRRECVSAAAHAVKEAVFASVCVFVVLSKRMRFLRIVCLGTRSIAAASLSGLTRYVLASFSSLCSVVPEICVVEFTVMRYVSLTISTCFYTASTVSM